ncbi:hypothetical protein, partial [Liquorilactobacillus satsumensis]|uniref:hypothetical protein n=1 Tax=Liquorilactobacillus satsumensis TaxID=259059 RepID=UPI0039EADE36
QPPAPKPAFRVTKLGLLCNAGLSLRRQNAECRTSIINVNDVTLIIDGISLLYIIKIQNIDANYSTKKALRSLFLNLMK